MSAYLALVLYYPALAARYQDGSSVPAGSKPSTYNLF
jgi:hypothetical protein